jgi:hypothetical protein
MKRAFFRAVSCFALMAGLIVSVGCGVGISADGTKSTNAGGAPKSTNAGGAPKSTKATNR